MSHMSSKSFAEQTIASLPVLDDGRRAGWLLSEYASTVWEVADTRNLQKRATIDFRVRLADGRLLIDATALYTTVKEYAWWVRDPRYSRIDDAIAHATMARNLMNLAHALSLRNIWSFAYLQPYDLEQLVEECRYGCDAVLHASERVDAYLQALAKSNEIDPQPFGGLPRYFHEVSYDGRVRRVADLRVDGEKMMVACNLPSSAKKLPRVAVLIAQAANANGLLRGKRQAHFAHCTLDPLPNVTVQALQRWLDPLEQLFAMRRRIQGDSIEFKPFPRGAARIAASKGVGTARTPIPPPKLALHLFEHAARWIFDYARPKFDPQEQDDTLRMATACWIIIAAFTARRREEIDDLRDGCLQGDEKSGWWLQVYIAKTLQRNVWIPVPKLVVRAVEVMSAISATARQRSCTDHLFQWLDSNGKTTCFDVGEHLDEFAEQVRVPLHRSRDGSEIAWHWHAHQFRRFFAVLYFYRFEDATIEALSHHLRHFSLEMTRRYVTQDPEVAALWNDVEWGYTRDLARSIVAGERSISGAAGERLKKIAQRLIDMFRRKSLVASPERVGASLALIMDRRGMVLTPKPWVTCTCPRTRDAAAKAACRRGKALEAKAFGPDFAQAGPSVCCSCSHAIMERTKLPYVDAAVDRLKSSVVSPEQTGTMFGALAQMKVVELSDARIMWYERASPVARPAEEE